MISPEQFVTRWYDARLAELDVKEEFTWGVSPLVHFNEAVVASLPLPETSQRFLIEAGLPAGIWGEYKGWRFGYPSNALPPITEALEDMTYPVTYAHYRMLGGDVLVPNWRKKSDEYFLSIICLDLEKNGQMVNVMSLPNYPVEFLNSSVPQLAEFILLWRQMIEWSFTHELKLERNNFEIWNLERVTYCQNVAEQMRQIDPPIWQTGLYWYEFINEAITAL